MDYSSSIYGSLLNPIFTFLLVELLPIIWGFSRVRSAANVASVAKISALVALMQFAIGLGLFFTVFRNLTGGTLVLAGVGMVLSGFNLIGLGVVAALLAAMFAKPFAFLLGAYHFFVRPIGFKS